MNMEHNENVSAKWLATYRACMRERLVKYTGQIHWSNTLVKYTGQIHW
eukprot:CAMPEP_0113726708 /NCGR_PEP_ID=MMETSP0038_2-20120614/40634_1 /TAXON_ID=2898 /ORGANISM="Cryptomonas paramecium" /LENGTH=47 /DNA_ID=CAMNT_0000657449 /DNA_START=20 /DNA_END=160 /DNA_ORIENTATION=+ /assembly_acc=CAM_ASM_000170